MSELRDILKEEYIKAKATGGVESALRTTNLRTELQARGLPVPRVTKKVKEKLEKKVPEVKKLTTKEKKKILKQKEVQKMFKMKFWQRWMICLALKIGLI